MDGLENSVVGITHVHCLADAQHLGQLIAERYNPEAIWISDMSATIGTYAGEGGLMVNVKKKEGALLPIEPPDNGNTHPYVYVPPVTIPCKLYANKLASPR